MASSVKVLQKAAFQLEAGQAGAGQSPGWGESGSVEALGADNAFGYLELGKGKSVEVVQDQSITSHAFKSVPRQAKVHVEKALSRYARFYGVDDFNYWMFGFENEVVTVVCFVLSEPSVDPTAGAVYLDGDLNAFTFLRKETWLNSTFYVFSADDGALASGATGDLSKDSGTGDATLSYTANSGLKYEHLLELAHDRHFTDYRTDEQITGYAAGDKKNRMATLGIKMATNDFRFPNAMCSSFAFSSEAGAFAQWANDFVAYDEERGDYSSSSWTFPSTRGSSAGVIAHNQMRVELGEDESSLTALGVTSLDLSVDIPLQILQDTLSGVYIAEPVLNGFYGVDCNIILSRYSATTYQALLEAWTSVVARISAQSGYNMMEMLIQEAKIDKAGPDDDGVAKEPLHLVPGSDGSSNNWSTWLHGNSLVQDGPVVMRVRNDNSSNMMFSI